MFLYFRKKKLRDLGYVDSWKAVPDIVKACQARKHIKQEISLGQYLREYQCVDCGYKYRQVFCPRITP